MALVACEALGAGSSKAGLELLALEAEVAAVCFSC